MNGSTNTTFGSRLVAQSQEELTRILNEIIQKTGLSQNDVLNLPTAQRFKINVNFQLAPKC